MTKFGEYLEELIYDDDFYNDCYGAFDDLGDLDEDDNQYNEQIRLNLIDNGYCMSVAQFVDYNYEDSEKLSYYMLDDGGSSYHVIMKSGAKFYDAYNYAGVTKLSNLKFVKLYYSKYSEEELKKFLFLISEHYFDYNKYIELKNKH